AFYKKSAAGGFPDAEVAMQEVPGYIKKTTFDASAFQNPDYMAAIYNRANISNADIDAFKRYVFGVVNELGSQRTLAIDSHCATLTRAAANMANLNVFRDVLPQARQYSGNSIVATMQSLMAPRQQKEDYLAHFQEDGEGDAAAMISRYGCQSDIAQRI